MDIETIASLGQKLSICPYYASKDAVRPADVVTLPYPLLFHQGTREAMQLDLKDSVILIDEAHNVVETVRSVYSSTLSLKTVSCFHCRRLLLTMSG